MRDDTNLHDLNTHAIHVTGFNDKSAKTKKLSALTLPDLQARILAASARTRDELPWLKLAVFGNKLSDHGSLRWDANVTAIEGVELDYDGKLIGGDSISYDTAIETVKRMGTRCIIYTTPSHKPAAPRWRLLIPLSKANVRLDLRKQYAARVNGFFDGIFASESFVLSQSYYYGRALDNPDADHRCDIIDGKFIDLQDDLYRYEKTGMPKDEAAGKSKDQTDWDGQSSRRSDDNLFLLLEQSRSRGHWHNSMRDAVASMVGRGWTDDAIQTVCGPYCNDGRYDDELVELIDGARKKWESPNDNGQAAHTPGVIAATPFQWIDPTKIPLRQWLYRPYYIRKYLSQTISPGGVGKSTLLIVEALAMVSGKELLNVSTDGELFRVWYWNGEDPQDELQHRIAAAIKLFGLRPDDIGDRLFLDSGRKVPIVLAEQGKQGIKIATPVIRDLIATLIKNKIDVLIIDPFISCHRVSENDNTAIDVVAKSWSAIAEAANCSIMIAHHTRKPGNNGGGTVDDGRGATSLANAARASRTLNNMTKEEAESAGIEEKYRRRHFRADLGRTALSPPAEAADWFKLESVDLENNPVMPGPGGDEIGVVTAWEYPTDCATVTVADIKRVQAAIAGGGPWRRDQRTNERWIGVPIALALNINITDATQKTRNKKRVEDRIALWLAKGLLKVESRPDPAIKSRVPVDFVVVGRPPSDVDVEGF